MRAIRAILCALAVIGLCVTTVQAGEVVVNVTNNAGKTMTYLYISAAGNRSWDEDILGPGMLDIRTLENGRYCEFVVEQTQLWDLRAEFRDGSVQEYYDIDFRIGRGLTLNRRDAEYD